MAEARREMCAGAVDRPLLAYVGRWSAEKRLHLLKQCRPAGVTLAFIGDGPMREVVEQWHDPPRVVVLPGMRPRDRLAVAYRAADWVVSASAFETFGNVPYEAAHCGTPALLQDAQGFNDQIDRETEDRGALLRFDTADGEKSVAAAMDRTAPLLADPERVRAAARAKSRDGVTVTEVLAEALEMGARERTGEGGRAFQKMRRLSCLALAFAWATCLAGVLAIMKVCMVGFMWVGVDFTAGMAHQRGAKKKWRARRSPSVADDLDALLAGDQGTRAGGEDASPAAFAAKVFSSCRRRRRGFEALGRTRRAGGRRRRRGRVRAEEGPRVRGARDGEKARHADVSGVETGERSFDAVRSNAVRNNRCALRSGVRQSAERKLGRIRQRRWERHHFVRDDSCFSRYFPFPSTESEAHSRARTSPLAARRGALRLGRSRVAWSCSPRRPPRARPAADWRGATPR